MTPKEQMLAWLRAHLACKPGLRWAEEHAESLEHAWKTVPDGEWVVWAATRPGVLDDRMLRKSACFCTRQVWGLLEDPRYREAVEVSERYTEGLASDEELAAASAAARAAPRAATRAARVAARAAIFVVDTDFTNDVANDVADYVAWAAACAACAACAAHATDGDAAWAAADVAESAIWAEQARWLREHVAPNFPPTDAIF